MDDFGMFKYYSDEFELAFTGHSTDHLLKSDGSLKITSETCIEINQF